ncbi:MAG: TIGR03546 family protein [Planctomycetales bacterium]|nr:TIGR03546 family protein [Planctomycetales bacterium]
MHLLDYLNPLRHLMRIFSKERTPRQLAMGVALGLMIGLVPKGNLIAVMLTMLLLGLKVNLGMGLITAFGVTCIGPSVDRLSHGIGVRAFETPWFYDAMCRAYQLPIVPWTSLNNTVVVGSLCLGLILFYPAYHFSESAASALQPVWRRWKRRDKPQAGDGDEPLATVAAVAEVPSAEARLAAETLAEGPSPDEAIHDNQVALRRLDRAGFDLGGASSDASTDSSEVPPIGAFATADDADSIELSDAASRLSPADEVATLLGSELGVAAPDSVSKAEDGIELSANALSAQADRAAYDNLRVQEVIERLRGVSAPGERQPAAAEIPGADCDADGDAAAPATMQPLRDQPAKTSLAESLARTAAAGESLLARAPEMLDPPVSSLDEQVVAAKPAAIGAKSEPLDSLPHDIRASADVDAESNTIAETIRAINDRIGAARVAASTAAEQSSSQVAHQPADHSTADVAASATILAPLPSRPVDTKRHIDPVDEESLPPIPPTELIGEQRTIVPYSQILAARQRAASPRDPVTQFLELLSAKTSQKSDTHSDVVNESSATETPEPRLTLAEAMALHTAATKPPTAERPASAAASPRDLPSTAPMPLAE